MNLNQDDLRYFVDYVLLDETHRTPSGKRQNQAMQGFWMSRGGKLSIRQSDRRVRYWACMEALRTIQQLSVAKAAALVATEIGRRTAAEVAVIRVAYYEYRGGRHQLNLFFSDFLRWRDWVLGSDEETLHCALDHYGKGFGKVRRERLASLFHGIRSDPGQVARNRDWHLEVGQQRRARIECNHWDPESQWQELATDLWALGRLHAAVGDGAEAKKLLDRALVLWKTHGATLPHLQVEAIAALNNEIGRLEGTEPSKARTLEQI